MIAILLFAALAGSVLALLLARFGPRRLHAENAGPALPFASLRALTVELLGAMGFTLRPEGMNGDGCLSAVRTDALGESRYVVVISDDAVVEQAAVLAAAETVKAEGGARGMLVTAGEIVKAGVGGLDVPLELVDGKRLRQLIIEHLPARVGELDRYRGSDSDSDRWVNEGGNPLSSG